MSKCIDLTGRKFGKLTVLKRVENYIKPNGKQESQWLCECDCKDKTQIIVRGWCLNNKNTQSCGCLQKERVSKSHKKYNIYDLSGEYGIGCTKQRTDKWNGKHARHGTDNEDGIRCVRTAKHRYIFFCTKNKKLKKLWNKLLKYPVLPYPKGNNRNYNLGDVYYPALIDKNNNLIDQNDKKVFSINLDKYNN